MIASQADATVPSMTDVDELKQGNEQLLRELADTAERLEVALRGLRDIANPQTPLSPGLSGNGPADRAKRTLRELGQDH